MTDYDCWREGHDDVDVSMVVKTAQANAETFRNIVVEAVRTIPENEPEDVCATALKYAVMTKPEAIPSAAKEFLAAILDKKN